MARRYWTVLFIVLVSCSIPSAGPPASSFSGSNPVTLTFEQSVRAASDVFIGTLSAVNDPEPFDAGGVRYREIDISVTEALKGDYDVGQLIIALEADWWGLTRDSPRTRSGRPSCSLVAVCVGWSASMEHEPTVRRLPSLLLQPTCVHR